MDRIGRKRSAKSRGQAIEMPPLHEALVEIHREYERASKAANDMTERYKDVSAVAEELRLQYANVQEENKKMKEELLQWETQGQPSASKSELQQRLSDAEKAQQEEATRAKTIESRNKELEEQVQSTKT